MQTHVFRLDNGLRCVVCQRPNSAMATVNVMYDVGSRDESRCRTGMAHLFEHLMFGGSANAPSFDGILESAGGNSNAWTSTDFTNFYETLPAANLETALFLESDRMQALNLSRQTLEVQRAVVIEEFKQTHLNQPYGDMSHRLRAAMYRPEHPYAWPTIGLTPEHIASVSLEEVGNWYHGHYAPGNAVISIVAPQEPAQIAELVRKWFGDIPEREVAKRRIPQPGFPQKSVTKTVCHPNVPQPRIVIAYPMAEYGTPEYFAADTLTDILSAGRSGRCRANLIQGPVEGLFADADASIVGSEHDGMLLLTAMLDASADASTTKQAARMLDDELRALALPGNIGERELERTLNNFEATYAFEGISARGMALRMATALYHGEDPDAMVAERRSLTPEGLVATAAAVTQRPKVTLIYRGQQPSE